MLKSESIAALAKAIALSQLHVENALKSSTNPHFKSKYADLAEILNTVRPVFSANGIAIVQTPTFESGVASVETMLCHESGEFISSVCSSPVSKQDAQGIGSAITYLRRYSLAAMCGIAQEDDDGQHAVQEPQTQRQAPSRKLSNAEREMGVADMKGAPDEAALKQVWADYHAMAKNIGDRESCEFFTDCAKECKAAFQ
ncbi:MAG TPA: ERF family protein [Methylotenera sp.]|jgi:hypothetical protein|nr:ERF family protein [Methylotenera sp.]